MQQCVRIYMYSYNVPNVTCTDTHRMCQNLHVLIQQCAKMYMYSYKCVRIYMLSYNNVPKCICTHTSVSEFTCTHTTMCQNVYVLIQVCWNLYVLIQQCAKIYMYRYSYNVPEFTSTHTMYQNLHVLIYITLFFVEGWWFL